MSAMPTRREVYDFVKSNVGPNHFGDDVWADVFPALISSRNKGRKSQFCAAGVIHSEKQTGVPVDDRMLPGITGSLWVPTCRTAAIDAGLWGDVSRIATTGGAKLMDKLTFDWDHDKLSDHVGFFVSMRDARRVNTIEWNTSRNGDGRDIGIWERVRFVSDIQGFIRSPYRDDGGPVSAKDAKAALKASVMSPDAFDGNLGPNTARGLQRFYAAQKRVPKSAIDGSLEGPSLTVTEVQRDLIRIGLLPAGSDDGFLGPQTKEALMKRFGVQTWKAAVQNWQFQLWSAGFLR